MSLIHIADLTFSYEGSYDNIFENVSFQIDTDWKLGFTGRNGRGKTTFLNLLLGNMEYKGNITASVQFEYFPYEVSDKTQQTLELAEEMNRNMEFWQLRKELSCLNVDEEVLYRPFETLSYGEQTKVLLAVLFTKENHFLLIDEPTNHLDNKARKIVASYLNSKKGFILVSHDRNFLDECIDHILTINKTNIEIQKGNFSSWYQNKQFQDEFERSENEKLKKEIKRLTDAAKQSSEWADHVESTKIGKASLQYEKCMDTRAYIGEQSRRMQMRRKNLEKRKNKEIEDKKDLLKNIETMDTLKLNPLSFHKNTILTMDNISLFYGENEVCSEVSFALKQGDRIALQGKNGCGKTTLLKLIAGEAISYQGNMEIGSGLILSVVQQDTSFLNGNLSDFAYGRGIDESLLKALLRKLDFSRVQFEKPMELYSEGQKKKVLIAGSLCEKAHLYLWDEPFNFIDVFSRIQIEKLILAYAPTLLFVEHDQSFVEHIATQTVVL